MSSIGIRHIGIVVNDLDKMIEFYNLLGFEKFIDTEIKGKLVEKLIGINNVDIRIVKLKAKDDSIIELLQYKDTYFFKDKIKLYDKGISHLAITVENIDEIFESLKLKGTKFISSPMITSDNVKVCFCRDVEGNFVELVEGIIE